MQARVRPKPPALGLRLPRRDDLGGPDGGVALYKGRISVIPSVAEGTPIRNFSTLPPAVSQPTHGCFLGYARMTNDSSHIIGAKQKSPATYCNVRGCSDQAPYRVTVTVAAERISWLDAPISIL